MIRFKAYDASPPSRLVSLTEVLLACRWSFYPCVNATQLHETVMSSVQQECCLLCCQKATPVSAAWKLLQVHHAGPCIQSSIAAPTKCETIANACVCFASCKWTSQSDPSSLTPRCTLSTAWKAQRHTPPTTTSHATRVYPKYIPSSLPALSGCCQPTISTRS